MRTEKTGEEEWLRLRAFPPAEVVHLICGMMTRLKAECNLVLSIPNDVVLVKAVSKMKLTRFEISGK